MNSLRRKRVLSFARNVKKELRYNLKLSIMLSLSGNGSFSISVYSLPALLACCCWGLENSCTRKLSQNDPAKIVIVKGFGSGTGSVIVASKCGERLNITPYILMALLLGFVAYGLSIYTYVYAQRYIGAAKTSAFYALAPFIGSLISLILFPKIPALLFIIFIHSYRMICIMPV